MSKVMVRYKVKPDEVAANEELVRDVYAELAETNPAGFHYGTFKLADGVSFVHLASQDGPDNPLARLGAFQRFQEGIGARCDEQPVVTTVEEVGSFALYEAAP